MGWKLFSAPSLKGDCISATNDVRRSIPRSATQTAPFAKGGREGAPIVFGVDVTPKRVVIGVLTAVYLIMGTAMIFTYSAPVPAQAVNEERAAHSTAPTEQRDFDVVLVTEEAIPEPTPVPMDDVLALAIGIDAVISSVPGGENCTDTTLIMIGNVIVNRTYDARYPGTIMEVLTQPMQFSCFSESGLKWVGVSSYRASFKERCSIAAERVLAGERVFDNSVVYVSGSKQGTVIAQLDGLYFCR